MDGRKWKQGELKHRKPASKTSIFGIFDSRGGVLILSLWTVMLISLLAMSVAFRTRLESQMERFQRLTGLQPYAALDQINRVRLILKSKSDDKDSQSRLWNDEEMADALKALAIAQGKNPDDDKPSFHVRMEDEQSKLDLNLVTPEILEQFFRHLKSKEKIRLQSSADDWIGGILYWRGASWLKKRAKTGRYYKKMPFESVDEMLFIPGVSKADVEILKPYFTVYSVDLILRINVNTAPQTILRAVFDAVPGDHFARERIWAKLSDFQAGENGNRSLQSLRSFLTAQDLSSPQMFLERIKVSTTLNHLDFASKLLVFLTAQADYFKIKLNPVSPEIKGQGVEAILGPAFPASWKLQPDASKGARDLRILSWQRVAA